MKAAGLLIFAALIFALCFGVDQGTAFLRRWAEQRDSVRMPLRYPVLTVLLGIAAVGVGIYAVRNRSVIFGAAAVLFLGVSVYAALTYRSARIDYDADSFTYRMGRQTRTFRFGDISSQRVAINKGGCCLVLVLGSDEAVFYSNMQGFAPFLDAAYLGWCRANDLDPEAQDWHDPSDHRWFPDDEEAE